MTVEEHTPVNQPDKHGGSHMAACFEISNFFCDFSPIDNQISIRWEPDSLMFRMSRKLLLTRVLVLKWWKQMNIVQIMTWTSILLAKNKRQKRIDECSLHYCVASVMVIDTKNGLSMMTSNSEGSCFFCFFSLRTTLFLLLCNFIWIYSYLANSNV